MKLGLDFHGVITDNPEFFKMLADIVIASGGEVHIITGSRYKTLMQEFLDLGLKDIKCTDIFSVSDYHINNGEKVDLTDPNFPKMDEELWDKTKADYCRRKGIDLMIDDSPHYGEYFTTPYMLYKNGTNEDLFRYDVVKKIRKRTSC